MNSSHSEEEKTRAGCHILHKLPPNKMASLLMMTNIIGKGELQLIRHPLQLRTEFTL